MLETNYISIHADKQSTAFKIEAAKTEVMAQSKAKTSKIPYQFRFWPILGIRHVIIPGLGMAQCARLYDVSAN